MPEDGAVPLVILGDNEGERTRDKLWKLRPIANKIEQRFLKGWSFPAVFPFDEGVLPATSKRNSTRVFMPDKPHPYRSKIFMSFEMYIDKRNTGDVSETGIDNKTGAAAVVRNLKIVLRFDNQHQWRAVERIWHRYRHDKQGQDKNIKVKSETRPASIPRGYFACSRYVTIPMMIAFHYKPVHYLCTDAVMTVSTIGRKVHFGAMSSRSELLSALDGSMCTINSAFKLTRGKLQPNSRSSFNDLALVNAHISHKETTKITGATAMTSKKWYSVVPTPPPTHQKRKRTRVPLTHALELSENWVTKRRQRSCKVCALSRTDRKKKSFATAFFCDRCPIDDAKYWLCQVAEKRKKTRRELQPEDGGDAQFAFMAATMSYDITGMALHTFRANTIHSEATTDDTGHCTDASDSILEEVD
ncbi:LOW QUALITY PROTEIN: Hypothetical protein PHPALM_11641 [Phytophthora palmivora]|uniref:PiggyBac transposable element-derived protein domain-containing protein n=1 Tax=Phytophthora palmivora TaxID=4796 RepID=A0A2P4Y1Q6_9STRA|nr:LOW QUALITY PROTEIN: Hypothetical protein PHPALM_11641 [Phytophthora palmivora]